MCGTAEGLASLIVKTKDGYISQHHRQARGANESRAACPNECQTPSQVPGQKEHHMKQLGGFLFSLLWRLLAVLIAAVLLIRWLAFYKGEST
jgi:hypothetical protein